jgi:hypothetical protein
MNDGPQHNRRREDKITKVLAKKIDQNSIDIKNVNAALQLNVEHIDNVLSNIKEDLADVKKEQRTSREEVKPILELMHDVGAVGKFGRFIKNTITWFAVVGGAAYALWEWVKHLGHIK